jgi:predicted AlkP superfamily pyrophosphatase or phosphodiesterase
MWRRGRRAVPWLIALAVSLGRPGALGAGESPRPSVLVISVDGLRPTCYTKPEAEDLKVPNLRALMARGAFATGVFGVLPTVTYPSHTTLLTGVLPRVHGIESNTIFDPEGRAAGAWNWYAKNVKVPTLVSAARAAGLRTAAVWWPVAVGLVADWNFPEFWRTGSDSPVDLDLLDALSTPGLIAAVARDRDRPFLYPITDDERTDAAIYLLKTGRPDLMLLHLVAVDFASHESGPYGAEARAAVEATDARIGRVLAALQEAGMANHTLVAIVSDHGFLPVSRSLQPNTVLRAAGLIRADAKGRVESWQAIFHTNGGSAGLVAADPNDDALVARVRALFEPRLHDPSSGVLAILDRDRIAALGGSDTWRLVLDAREGFDLSTEATGPWSVSSGKRGDHGYSPERPELFASLVLAGPGLARTGDLGIVHMTAIAPTLARYLGLHLAPEADAPLPLW